MRYYIMCAALALLIGIFIGLYAGYRIYGHRLANSRGQSEKHLMLVRFYDVWMMTKQEGKSIPEYLKKRNLTSIAIYGMSFLGNRLYYELRAAGIDVKYGIDRNPECAMLDFNIYQPDDLGKITEKKDTVIVTSIFAYDAVREMLKKNGYSSIICLDEILYHLLRE